MTYAQTRALVLQMLPKGGVGAEVGVWKGDLSAQILADAAPKRLYLIDPWAWAIDPGHARAWYSADKGADMNAIFAGVQARFSDEIAAGQVEIHRAPSKTALAALPDNSLDFVYVDGDHAFDAVRRDLEMAVQKTKPSGLICVDDHRLDKWWGDGVVRAVNEALGAHAHHLAVVFAAHTQVVIQKRV